MSTSHSAVHIHMHMQFIVSVIFLEMNYKQIVPSILIKIFFLNLMVIFIHFGRLK